MIDAVQARQLAIRAGQGSRKDLEKLLLDLSDSVVDLQTGTATVTVAAADAPTAAKKAADYVCDGTADDVEINAAVDASPLVKLSTGTFNISSSILIGKDSRNLIGSLLNGTILKAVDGLDDHVIDSAGVVSNRFFCRFADFTIDGNKANNSSGNGINAEYAHSWIIERLHIKDCDDWGITFLADHTDRLALNNRVLFSRIEDCGQGLSFGAFAPNNHAVSNIIGGNDGLALVLLSNDEAIFELNHVHSAGGVGINVQGNNNQINNNIVESSQSHGIQLTGTGGHGCSHNFLFNNGKSGTGSGINLLKDRCRVVGNRAYDKAGAGGTQEYGIDIDAAADSNIVAHNQLAGNKTGAINGTGTNTLGLADNITS